MTKKVSITIECNNVSFGDNDDNLARREVVRILRDLFDDILEKYAGDWDLNLPLIDYNGNTVGIYEEIEEEDE